MAHEDETIYFGSGDRKIWALTSTGMTKWQYLTTQPIIATPLAMRETTLADGTVSSAGLIIGGLDGWVYKLNVDGSLAWKFNTTGQVRGAAALTREGHVIVGSTDKHLYCLHSGSGAQLWNYSAGQEVTSSAVIQDVSITFGTRKDSTGPGRIIALKKDGTLRWELTVTSSVEGDVIEDARTGTVYAATNDGKIYAVQADGRMQWRYLTGCAGGVCGDYSKSDDGEASPSENTKCSFSELGAHGATSPCLLGDVIITTSQNKFVYGLALDGRLLWKFPTEKRIRSPPRCLQSSDLFGVVTNTVLSASNDRHLYSLSF